MIKILVADDHAIVREGLKQIVSEEIDMMVAGEASDSVEMFSLLESGSWDIIVLDINMPGQSGLDALKDIKNKFRSIPVLVLSMYSEEQYGIRAIRAGASGFLKKVSAPEELVLAIRKIVSGGKYISNELADRLAAHLGKSTKELLHESLSDRELHILCQIASGLSAEQIADDLSISIHTVYSYRNRILEKMNMRSNVELTQYAIQNGLIQI